MRRGGTVIRRRKVAWYELTAERAFWLFAAFAAFVFLTGGGSRYDIVSVGPLRFVAALVLALVIVFQTRRSLRRVAVPILALLALALWMAVQLVPLPTAWWSSLPGRETIYELGRIVGIGEVWRPITLSPQRTANSLASLVVPLAALLTLALIDENGWRRVKWVVIVAGVASALLGVAQIVLSDSPGLYLYEITNRGSAVGLFSNTNHNAIFLAIALLFCTFRIEQISLRKLDATDLFVFAAALVIFSGLMVNGSRTGLGCLILVGLISAARATFIKPPDTGHGKAKAKGRAGRRGNARFVLGMAMGAISVGLIGLFALFGRSRAISALIAEDASQDLRLRSLPYVWQLVREHQPWGAGFGAFEQAYRMVEPASLLSSTYFNNAHDDWLQFALEGGLPAILIGVVFLGAVAFRVLRIARMQSGSREMRDNAWLGALTLAIFASSSIFDYPLRTPALMLVAAIALAMLFKPLAGGGAGLAVEEGSKTAKPRKLKSAGGAPAHKDGIDQV